MSLTSWSRLAFVPLVPFVMLAGIAAAEEKPATFPTNEQLRHFKAMGDPRLSPDGKQVLIRMVDATADGAKGHLWLVPVDGSAARQLTYSPDADKVGERSGMWMPDGQSILFLAHRGEHTSLFRLPMNGGEAKAFDLKVTPLADESKLPGALPTTTPDATKSTKEEKPETIAIDVAGFRVSPDGKTIALIAADPQTPGEKKQKDAKADAAWVDHETHGSRLYLLDVATSKLTVTGLAIDVRGAEWSSDSSKLIAEREEPNGESELGPAGSGWIVSMSDPAHPSKVDDLPATLGSAAWSVDGGSIVYLAQAKHEAPPGYSDLYTYTLATKSTKNLTDGFDGSIGRMEPLPLKDGSILEIAEKGVVTAPLKVSADGHSTAIASPTATVSSLVTNSAETGFVYLGNSGGSGPRLFYTASLSETPKALATPSLAPEGLKSLAPKRISWKSDGFTIDGLLYLPPQAATGKVPLVVEVHGGPLGAYVDSYSLFVDYLLGKGWAVLETNPRGSTGRGAAFAAANKNDLGGGDYRDIMAGVDSVLKTTPIDPAKLALTGYSYGGEMAGFVETKTERFKAIVSMAPVIDQNSEYGTERGSFYDQWYFGKPWEHEADAWRQSPLSGAAHAKTPFLLIQGESDTTDPLGQSQEMYRALRQMKVPVELVTYPRVDHGPLGGAIYGSPTNEPWHGFDARRRIVNFIARGFGEAEPEK
ncbi:dipeptidyl aminopeptidase/acylaminoacyl peptidase [Granulicella aggregans]|uniref:Dipeptidyl aminopeptidase/acylaminoacyl peptidase n=1 Tax=Granulicella aggregans TaxID=474949 RepID=A0A7W7ZBS7_9BACT|nr:prolyl oligopeptidase family serine peptidase [Granulicella aggregans]MBB5056991.1 dipeptidyl aminopeptidase/acylaminoacyl peptidase [Granulicella aggregans]